MSKELKISELASIWNVSIPTTWNRIRKLGLTTVKKIDENKKEIAFVTVSDEILKRYINNVDNHYNNGVNNRYYEDMLINNNNINNDSNIIDAEYTRNSAGISNEIFEKLQELNNEYNERLERYNERYHNSLQALNNELLTYKSQIPLLTDKAEREGVYLAEINQLKEDNKKLEMVNNKLKLTFIFLLLTFILIITTVFLTLFIVTKKPVEVTTPPQVELLDEKEKPNQPLPAPQYNRNYKKN